MLLTVVFDTNILFSATAWRGNPFQCVERARLGEIQAVTCLELMEELADKLELRLKFSAEQAVDTLADYLGFLRMVSIPKLLDAVPRDPDDNMVLECAIEGKAQYIVTGDKDLLVLKVFRDIPNSPRQRLPKTFYEDSIRGHNTAWIMHLHYHVGQDFLAEQLGIAL